MFPHRHPRPKPRTFVVGTLLLLGLSAVAFVDPATADHGSNTGTIKVHEGVAADPPQRNEPHVSGDVFVEGFNMAEDGGDLLFYSWPPTGEMELVLATVWEADGGEPVNHFLAGPFVLPCGHYRVFAYNGDGPEDPTEPQPGQAKKKTFWVEGCAEPSPDMACPTDLEVVANDDGSVTLTFTPAPGSDGTNIYRADGEHDFEYVTTVGPDVTEFTDTTTVPGETYAYQVTALFGTDESQGCAIVEVVAIPVFPTAMAFGLALLLGMGAYLALALRRKV